MCDNQISMRVMGYTNNIFVVNLSKTHESLYELQVIGL